MQQGDYLVRFTARQTIGAGGHRFGDDLTMSQMLHRKVIPVLHASGALEITKPGDRTTPAELVTVYGPGFWQSLTPLEWGGEDLKVEEESTDHED